MHALQGLGEALIALDQAKLVSSIFPSGSSTAIIQARSIRAHEGRRRQLQFIGKLMRNVDPDPVREAIQRFDSGIRSNRVEFAAAERWREGMLATTPGHAPGDRASRADLQRSSRH